MSREAQPLDHPEIDDARFVDRYLLHELSEEEEARFEEHLLTCGECLDQVEADERFGLALRSVEGRGEVSVRSASPAPSHRLRWAWAASILLALLPAWWLHRQAGELEDRLRLATGPRVDVPVLHLAPVRGAEDGVGRDGGEVGAAHRLTLADDPEWVVLIVEPAGSAERFRLELTGPDGESVLRTESVAVDAYGALTVTIYSTDLRSGAHRLRLEPEDGGASQWITVDVLRDRADP